MASRPTTGRRLRLRQPRIHPLGHNAATQALKCVADCDELEGCAKIDRLRGSGDPGDIGEPAGFGFRSAVGDGLLLLVDRPYLGEVRCERESDLSGATGKIQKCSASRQWQPLDEVVQEGLGVRQSVLVVERCGTAIEVGPETELPSHIEDDRASIGRLVPLYVLFPCNGRTPTGLRQPAVRAAVTATVAYCMVKRPPTASMAVPMPASSASSLSGGNWLWPPDVGTQSSHSSRV